MHYFSLFSPGDKASKSFQLPLTDQVCVLYKPTTGFLLEVGSLPQAWQHTAFPHHVFHGSTVLAAVQGPALTGVVGRMQGAH